MSFISRCKCGLGVRLPQGVVPVARWKCPACRDEVDFGSGPWSKHSPHDWEVDKQKTRISDLGLFVWNCRHCRCVAFYQQQDPGSYTSGGTWGFKPYQFVLSPFKRLDFEPPCPARWDKAGDVMDGIRI